MKHKALVTIAVVAAIAALIATSPTFAHGPGFGQGYTGHGSMAGMHGGPGFGGMGMNTALLDDVTVDTVREFLETRITWMGNSDLEIGEVTETDRNTIAGEIVSKDGTVSHRVEFDRETGRHYPVQ